MFFFLIKGSAPTIKWEAIFVVAVAVAVVAVSFLCCFFLSSSWKWKGDFHFLQLSDRWLFFSSFTRGRRMSGNHRTERRRRNNRRAIFLSLSLSLFFSFLQIMIPKKNYPKKKRARKESMKAPSSLRSFRSCFFSFQSTTNGSKEERVESSPVMTSSRSNHLALSNQWPKGRTTQNDVIAVPWEQKSDS